MRVLLLAVGLIAAGLAAEVTSLIPPPVPALVPNPPSGPPTPVRVTAAPAARPPVADTRALRGEIAVLQKQLAWLDALSTSFPAPASSPPP